MDEPKRTAPLVSDNAANQDALDFSPYTNTLLDIIRDPNTQGPLVIGLFGTWGSGKTSLMQFVRNDLKDNIAQNNGRRFRLAWFDAWRYEKEEALWRALLLRVVDNLREHDEQGKETTPKELRDKIEKLEESLYHDVQWEEKGDLTIDWPKLAGAVAGSAVRLSFSMLPGFAAQAVEAAQKALGGGNDVESLVQVIQRETIKHHQAELRSIEQFQKQFGDLIADCIVKQNERLVVFVDDLDRCLPEKAIEVLEAIKLFLDVPGCIFLLGLDQDVVTRGIKVKYRGFAVDDGAAKAIPIDGGQYLEKIIQLPFRLPKIEPKAMQPFIESLAVLPDKRCAQVFAEGLETNPRKVKRAVNVFLFISKLAEKRGLPTQAVRLAKIVVIYHSHSELYDLLNQNPTRLRDLENYLRKQVAQTERERGKPEMDAAQIVRETPPVDERLIKSEVKQVLTLFLDDENVCFANAEYDEIASYFRLTRGTIADSTALQLAKERQEQEQKRFEILQETQRKISEIQAEPTGEKAQATDEVFRKWSEYITSEAPTFPVPTFVSVPAGEFLMGTSDQEIEYLLKTTKWAKERKEKGYFNSEQPQHRVILDAFQIGKYPVTNAEYQAFVKETKRKPPSHWSGGTFSEDLAAHPVVYVSWQDATAYCEWLAKKLSAPIRLPTEAEWEKASSWDESKKLKRLYPWGNEWDAAKCNSSESKIGTTTPVGKYSPGGDSFFGIADMAGNVWEWCADWYGEDHYKNSLPKNSTGPDSGQYRILRGGSWYGNANFARCASRYGDNPDSWYGSRGFRCARSLSL